MSGYGRYVEDWKGGFAFRDRKALTAACRKALTAACRKAPTP